MRGYVLSIWSLIDPIYYYCTRLTYLPRQGAESNIFRVRLTKYKGREIVLSDGTEIKKNDTLVKVHLHNVKLLKEIIHIKNEIKKAKIIYRHVQNSLPGLAEFIQRADRSDEIKGVIGITFLNKGCERLGFEVVDITSHIYKGFKWCTFLPIELISSGNSVRHILQHHSPKYLFMSKGKLLNLYGEKNKRKSCP
ncbi:hypothetical protein HR057_04780 [Bacillus sp. P2(2020)]|uniref:YkoP-like domain-containing protein n=2 Tax=Calidifontibacillus erzurumensis TaxID=2741433 RepID=A0A8J8GF19_9BACI|nr:hypothetical protein [Calidifontibacillus erzurumensis]